MSFLYVLLQLRVMQASSLFSQQDRFLLLSVPQLTLGRRLLSRAQGHQTASWLQWPQAGCTSHWDTAPAAGGVSHSPLSLWECPRQTSASCSLYNIETTFVVWDLFITLYMHTSNNKVLLLLLIMWIPPAWKLTLAEVWGTGQYHLIILTLFTLLFFIDACKPKSDVIAGIEEETWMMIPHH